MKSRTRGVIWLYIGLGAQSKMVVGMSTNSPAIRQDVCQSTFGPELAVALTIELAKAPFVQFQCQCTTFWKYLQGAWSEAGSTECENGQALPA